MSSVAQENFTKNCWMDLIALTRAGGLVVVKTQPNLTQLNSKQQGLRLDIVATWNLEPTPPSTTPN